jgi:Domain of unknown function (DUF4383)
MNTKNAAILFGVVFLLVGALGYFPNPIVGPTGIFLTNPLHNIVHIASGIVLLLGAYTGLGSQLALRIVGVVYGLVAICGFFMVMNGMMMGVAINDADKWLHVALAAVILLAGFALPGEASARRATA